MESLVRSLARFAGPDPFIHGFFPELPELADLVGRHLVPDAPLVDRVPLHPEVGGHLLGGQPSVFDHGWVSASGECADTHYTPAVQQSNTNTPENALRTYLPALPFRFCG